MISYLLLPYYGQDTSENDFLTVVAKFRFCSIFTDIGCLFPLDVQNEIQLLSRVFCYFMASLFIVFFVEKYVTGFRMASFSFFHRA